MNTSSQVLALMERDALVPVFSHPDVAVVQQVMKACHDGGLRVFEVTARCPNAPEVFPLLVDFAARQLPGMMLGTGSIVDAGSAASYIRQGAAFIVGPLFNRDIARVCSEASVPYIPGCATPTEIGAAQEAGCVMCKVFPGEVLGPAFVKAVLGPMPWSRLMVTGGVRPEKENLAAWLASGAACVGIGSHLFPAGDLSGEGFGRIARRCGQVLSIIRELRQSAP